MSSRYAHRMHLGFAWGDTAFDLIRPLEDKREAVYILRRGLASFGTDMMRFLVDLMLQQQERYRDRLLSVSCLAVHAERDEDLDAETNFFASALRVFYRPK